MGNKKKTSKFVFKCIKCGYIPEPNKEKSNKNWNVIDCKCPKCGGQIKMDIEWID